MGAALEVVAFLGSKVIVDGVIAIDYAVDDIGDRSAGDSVLCTFDNIGKLVLLNCGESILNGGSEVGQSHILSILNDFNIVNSLGINSLGVNSLGINNLGINSLGINSLGINNLGINNLNIVGSIKLISVCCRSEHESHKQENYKYQAERDRQFTEFFCFNHYLVFLLSPMMRY